jgi:hypothetical protein
MGEFNFRTCVVIENAIYCTDRDGNVYRFPLPEKVAVKDCPVCAIEALLKAEAGGGKA